MYSKENYTGTRTLPPSMLKQNSREGSMIKVILMIEKSCTLISLIKFQMKIADMATRLESARLLTWKAAMLKDAGKDYTKVENFIWFLCLSSAHFKYLVYLPDTLSNIMNAQK